MTDEDGTEQRPTLPHDGHLHVALRQLCLEDRPRNAMALVKAIRDRYDLGDYLKVRLLSIGLCTLAKMYVTGPK